ncbi:uncharacterized protein LOC118946474 isoform X5 [Oncorhynchus mykiss]|uniref:uncharacterized protein LOC118946473 isoform X5 n=1 Tax=Oncorhynchus mykiss TaxID=8022 RepID=UPI001878DF04|nr:uncharacterized protein LOC118946473 isoform X5 [Oncorhynchus mykiss]XP_036827021.1 uncharacterized protein LOC110489319 isoform X5 [Oncorhynchus mykiss]XP_036827026.1 uncharacterized protein LOC118946474 isoform X5 [Oncorhynchus mykiss]
MPGCFSRLTERVRGLRQPSASTGCSNSFMGCFCCLFPFCRVRDRREVDSDSDFEEESTVLDEVQLDVPLLPVILHVQDAAIILEEATGNWQLIPIRYSPLYCGPVVIRNNASPVAKAWRTFQFISPIITYMRGGSQQVVVRMHHVSRVRGLETQLVWAISKETARLSPEGIPYCATKVQSVTWIQYVAGRVTQYASHLRHETSVDVTFGCYQQQTDVSVVYATLHMGLDGLLSSSAWSEAASVSTPTNQQFTEPEPEGHNCYEGWEEDLLPEEREVPLLNLYLTTKRVEDIALRLVSLRQAFTDEAEFIRAYNDFVDYLSDPSKEIDIERELAEAKIHHVNLIDVLFELVLFGLMIAQKSLIVHPGGFMERLYALLYSFLPAAASIEPKAERYLLLLNGGLMALLDDMFGQQLAWYFNPESLVTELSSLLEYHLENLMASM